MSELPCEIGRSEGVHACPPPLWSLFHVYRWFRFQFPRLNSNIYAITLDRGAFLNVMSSSPPNGSSPPTCALPFERYCVAPLCVAASGQRYDCSRSCVIDESVTQEVIWPSPIGSRGEEMLEQMNSMKVQYPPLPRKLVDARRRQV
uniref:Uncharacterized protein n=1 Tax=Trichuris muris TaxID=70415 RepID=A0A5S6Q9Z9_TRIMR